MMRATRGTAIVLLSLIFAVAIVMAIVNGLRLDVTVLSIPGLLAMGPVGALLAQRRPENPIGWLFLVTGALTSCVVWAGVVVANTGDQPSDWEDGPMFALWFHNFAWIPIIVIATILVPMLFPGGWLSARWRGFGLALVAWYATFLVLAALSPTLVLDSGAEVPNPLSPTWLPVPSESIGNALGGLGIASLLVGSVAAGISVILRYAHGTSETRAQIRWFVLAIAFLLVGSVLSGTTQGWVSEVSFGLTTAFIPLATWIAITRHGLYDLGRIVSRTLAYLIVTGAALLTYVLLVTSISRLAPASSAPAVAVATLGAAAVFRPLLQIVRGGIDRKFNRAHYDAQHTIQRFGQNLRHGVDGAAISAQLIAVVAEATQPSHLTLWVKERT